MNANLNTVHPFTPGYQRDMLLLLLKDPTVYSQRRNIWNAKYWDDVDQRAIVVAYLNLRGATHQQPTKEDIIQEVAGGHNMKLLPKDIEERLKEVETLYATPTPTNRDAILQKVGEWAHGQGMMEAMGAGISHLHEGQSKKIKPLIDAADKIGEDTTKRVLHSVFTDLLPAQIDESKNILGYRLLEEGTYIVVIGYSGVGKSVLSMQIGSSAASGKPVLGIPVPRPLKTLLLQAEDSVNDLIEQSQCAGVIVPDKIERTLLRNKFIAHTTYARGEALFQELRDIQEEQEEKFRLFIINPAFAFLPEGVQAEDAEGVGKFLRHMLLPFLVEQEAAAIIMHHPPKLTHRDTSNWTIATYQYAAHGSAEWTNAPRSNWTIEQTSSLEVFQFIIGKRGAKSGWKRDQEGKYAKFFKYAPEGAPEGEALHWVEATEDDIADAKRTDDLKIQDIVDVFRLSSSPKLATVQIVEALKDNQFKVDNDWLVVKLKGSPKFCKAGDFWMLSSTVQQEEKETKANARQEKRDTVVESIYDTIKKNPGLSTNQLSLRLGMHKATLKPHLATTGCRTYTN